ATIAAGAILNLGISGLNTYLAADIPLLTSGTSSPGITRTFVLQSSLPPGWSVIYKNSTIPQEFNAGGAGGAASQVLGFNADTVLIRPTAGNVTPVTIQDFAVARDGAGVVASWTSVSEFQNAGFNLYRRGLESGTWTKVNPALIAGRITNPDAKIYRVYDWPAPGVYD